MSLAAVLPALIALGTPIQTGGTPPPLIDVPAFPAPTPPPTIDLPPFPSAEAAPTAPPAPAARVHHAKGDPLEGFNRHMFRAHEKFDHAIFRPVALGYKHAVPRPVRSGLRNFFSNLGEPIVALNYLLQLKPGKAAETLGRFIINSTFGVAGLMDVAKGNGVNLPHRPNGLGDTLGFYGVKPGPYLFLPFVGPTDLRDILGGQADGLVLPLAVGTPFDKLYYQIPKGVITGLDKRAESDDDLNTLFSTAVDPYATLRSVYLQDRAAEIRHLHGARRAAPATPELGEPLADPADTGAKPGDDTPELSDPLADPAAPDGAKAPAASDAPELDDPLADPAAAPH